MFSLKRDFLKRLSLFNRMFLMFYSEKKKCDVLQFHSQQKQFNVVGFVNGVKQNVANI